MKIKKENPQDFGKRAELRVQAELTAFGHWCKSPGRNSADNSAYDFLIDGKHRVEIKAARPVAGCPFRWVVNIGRHGKLDESKVDFYIIRLENVPGFKAAITLIWKAPIGRQTIAISLRSLLLRHSDKVKAWFEFLGDKRFYTDSD